jgi:DNA-binding transcriptional LysR family regulator
METQTKDLADLRAFCMVVDRGSITAAAKALGETKGAVSRRITRLERAVGSPLLRRSPRLVQATENGIAYRVQVGRALELLDDATTVLQDARATPSGVLRVTAPTDIGISLVAPLMADFMTRYPQITVEMILTETVLDFDANQVDVALRAAPSLRDSSLVAHKLERLEWGIFAAPHYLKVHRAPKRPEELEQHRLVLFRTNRGQTSLTLRPKGSTERIHVALRAALSVSEFSFAREVARAGAGVTLLPHVVAEQDVNEGRLVQVLKNYTLESAANLYLVHQGSRFLTSRVRAFRDYVMEAFESRGRSRRKQVDEPDKGLAR